MPHPISKRTLEQIAEALLGNARPRPLPDPELLTRVRFWSALFVALVVGLYTGWFLNKAMSNVAAGYLEELQ